MCMFYYHRGKQAPFSSDKLISLQNHTATYGFAPHSRHAVRVACHGERPVLDQSGKSQEEEIRQKHGLPPINKNGARLTNYND